MNTVIKVGAILQNEHGQILLIKERYEDGKELKWNIIKGTYDNAGETLADCVRREIKEEAGVEAGVVTLRQIYHYGNSADVAKILFVFSAVVSGKDVLLPSVEDQKERGEDIAGFQWFNKEDAKAIPEQDFIAPYAFMAVQDLNDVLDNTPVKIVNITK